MKNIKSIFMVSALSLGLVVGAVGVAGAATSTNYQKEIADWFENDHNPVVMHTNTVVTPSATSGATPGATPAQNNYHYNDGHSNMNPQQHKQMHITQPSENHMSGSESGHE